MTTPTVTPATDEEVESWRPHFPDGSKDIAARLIARIDAERAARERWRDWVETLTDKLDEALASLRWDIHDNWCPAATDAFLPYKKNPETPPVCNCWVSDSWAKVEGARAALSQTAEQTGSRRKPCR